jgi:hypothetical protein
MIAYRILDEDDPPKAPVSTPLLKQSPKTFFEKTSAVFEGETTECNYLVMAFVFGVLALALTDTVK